ncbi:hypothetical protein GWK47_029445 [Chionoecetes opilio]|uniref:Uncharacterized protein n=1 Tax=Chionoecetes opilio TaxID=41210 RepID=A0A8J4YKD3_CHIOP|nr:hypothetical protein GWK47_029445 [Chionoecetes opilio]
MGVRKSGAQDSPQCGNPAGRERGQGPEQLILPGCCLWPGGFRISGGYLAEGTSAAVQYENVLLHRMEKEPLVPSESAESHCGQQTTQHIMSHRECWSTRSAEEIYNVLSLLLSAVLSDVSQELVALLQERQGLQDEVDIRSITIEQLLKFAEKRQLQLGEPLAIQMSVVQNRCPNNASESVVLVEDHPDPSHPPVMICPSWSASATQKELVWNIASLL